MSSERKLKECAKNVRDVYKAQKHNWRYQMSYWGTGMRVHMAAIREEGLEVRPEILRLFEKAESLLKQHCDGQDCSFQS
jgi:hypothetical protein